jgi:hypothetical protein
MLGRWAETVGFKLSKPSYAKMTSRAKFGHVAQFDIPI